MSAIKKFDYVTPNYGGYSELHNIFNGNVGFVERIYTTTEFGEKVKVAKVVFNHSYVVYKIDDLVKADKPVEPRRGIAESIAYKKTIGY